MRVEDALQQITEIRERVQEAQVFRGYRAQAALVSALSAFAIAGLQSWILPEPTRHLAAYVGLWSAVAAFSIALSAVDLVGDWFRDSSGQERTKGIRAVRALLPSVATGAVLTAVIVLRIPEVGGLLPALWALLFAQGIFASVPLLPRGGFWIGLHYVAAGLLVLVWEPGTGTLAGWTMGVTFGLGQLLSAGFFASTRERRRAS